MKTFLALLLLATTALAADLRVGVAQVAATPAAQKVHAAPRRMRDAPGSERVLKEGGYEGDDAMIYYDRPQEMADLTAHLRGTTK